MIPSRLKKLKSTRGKTRRERIDAIAKRLTARWEKQQFLKQKSNAGRIELRSRNKPLVRRERNTRPRLRPIIAYDLETTRIAKGTPRPLYMTACGDFGFWFSGEIKDIEHLCDCLIARFLTPDNKGARFIAWNANNFDIYFVAAALLHSNDYVMRPYLTRSKNLRGLKVLKVGDDSQTWEFLDGCSMTMGAPQKLEKFLKVFAPDYLKLNAPNWETEDFDPKNPEHVAYAERDSEGLFHAMKKAQQIVLDNFNLGLQPTIGNLGIKIFAANIPFGTQVFQPSAEALEILRNYVLRGGYCYTPGKYEGPIWKYDINQAYAAAMRDSDLPAGRCIYTLKKSRYARCAIYRITAHNPKGIIPFYHRDTATGKSMFSATVLENVWVTSQELTQLENEKWDIVVHDGFMWDDHFRMTDYVNKLERLRVADPKGAQGTMMKSIGNNSYGKTVEQLEGLELLLANECPPGFDDYPMGENAQLSHVWFRFAKPLLREYHQPQLGAFITAHVRMQLRRAILTDPTAFLYADTDCVVSRRPLPLDIDGAIYGKWKIEAEGKPFRIIAKKVYADFGANEKHCKGLNVNRLTDADFVAWYHGKAPVQKMVHKNNFIKAMTGAEMFVERTRAGEKNAKRENR